MRDEKMYHFNETDYFYIDYSRADLNLVVVTDINFTRIITSIDFNYIIDAYFDSKNKISGYKSKKEKIKQVVDIMIEHGLNYDDLEDEYYSRIK